jgi:hypothetical protein
MPMDHELHFRQAEAHARLQSLNSSCSAWWAELADYYKLKADEAAVAHAVACKAACKNANASPSEDLGFPWN